MKRAFLVLLLFFILLCATGIQHTLAAPILSNDKMPGGVSLNEMLHALPTGIFAAGALVAAMGIGAEFWRALLPLCGADWAPTRRFALLADASLWCGWLTLGTCINAQFCIFPATFIPGAESLYSVENYRMLLLISCGTMICARLFNTYIPRRHGIFIVLLCAATAMAAGQFWWNGMPIDFLTISLLLPICAILLIPAHKELAAIPFAWLCLVALALVIYATGFSHLIISYPTTSTEMSSGWLSTKFAANTIFPICLIALLIPQLRKCRYIQQFVGAAGLLACILYNWAAFAAPLDNALGGQLPCLPAGIVYTITLLCLSALLILRLFCFRKR